MSVVDPPTTSPAAVQAPAATARAVPAVAPLDARVFAAAPATAAALPRTAPPVAARVGVDWLSWTMTSLVLTAFFVLIVSGRVVTEGPVLLVLSATHGIHEGDLFALAAACGGIALPVLRGWRRR